jgi:hypothetical protein
MREKTLLRQGFFIGFENNRKIEYNVLTSLGSSRCSPRTGDDQHICSKTSMVIIAKNQMSFSKLSFVGKTFDLPFCRFWLAGVVSHRYMLC